MRATVRKSENDGITLHIPGRLAAAADLYEGVVVNVRVDGTELVIRKDRPRYRLEDLLAGHSPDKNHREDMWGPAVGREVL